MSNLAFDLPESFQNNLKEILVIDPNLKVYQPQDKHDGIVFVERCLVRKGQYEPIEITDSEGNPTSHPTRTGALLIKETNFTDIGGGLQTFERHYATIPTSWYDFEEVSYRTTYWGAINYKTRSGGGVTWHKTRTVLAKRTHYYILRNEIPTTPVPDGDRVATEYVNDFNRIYRTNPEGRLDRDWEDYEPDLNNPTLVAISKDRVTKYLGDIYEFVRYTIEV